MLPIIKRKDLQAMEKTYAPPPQPTNEEDRRIKDQRFRILPGPGGFYIYDYLKFDVVKKDGQFFATNSREEIQLFLKTLPQEVLLEAFMKSLPKKKAA